MLLRLPQTVCISLFLIRFPEKTEIMYKRYFTIQSGFQTNRNELLINALIVHSVNRTDDPNIIKQIRFSYRKY